MMHGPIKPNTRRIGGKAFYRWPRITVLFDMPDGIRITANPHFHNLQHEYLQADGRWLTCAGRGFCKMCNREEAMKTTTQRLREALVEHFGYAHLATINDDQGVFDVEGADNSGRRFLGDQSDRFEMLGCIEHEFDIALEDDAADGNPTISHLVALIDRARAQ